MKVSQAAKNTRELMDGNVNRINHVTLLVKNIGNDFEEMIGKATVIGDESHVVTLASRKLAADIIQIGQAAGEISASAQKIAQGSKETSASSDELSSLAAPMKQFVDDLADLIGGKKTVNMDETRFEGS